MSKNTTVSRGRPVGQLTKKIIALKVGQKMNVSDRTRAVLGSFVWHAQNKSGFTFSTSVKGVRKGYISVTRTA